MASIAEQINQIVNAFIDPVTGKSFDELEAISSIGIDNREVSLLLKLAYPLATQGRKISESLGAELTRIDGVDQVVIELDQEIQPYSGRSQVPAMQGVKNVIAVASGKGGVGKSTTTVNLALAMAAEGARVGILDADIYGPSQGTMLGVAEGVRPQPCGENGFYPIEVLGIQSMSMSYLIEENTAMVWRGPMAAGALQQLLTQTQWQDLDYLFIDMPPGTGDIQLTLSQKVPVAGAVIVTTPQDIALLDAKKGIEMFRKVDIPVLGVLENMSTHICSQCGHEEAIFGAGGGEQIATDYETELLGQLPLALSIRQQADSGRPTVVSDPDSAYAASYREVALTLAGKLALNNQKAPVIPSIQIVDD